MEQTEIILESVKEEPALIHEELNIEIKNETEEFAETTNDNFEVTSEFKEELPVMTEDFENEMKPENSETETILPINSDELKEEIGDQNDESHMDLVSYDYPNFDDSMDSSEAAALSQVEACLNDEVNIKSEIDYVDKDYEKHLHDVPKIIKDENDLTVTETHIISNKVIDTAELGNVNHGLMDAQSTRTLIMEIHSLTSQEYTKLGNPEEILPTTSKIYDPCDMYEESFQLNSITSNILSLEQEAYKMKKMNRLLSQTKSSELFVCPKCPKTFKAKDGYKRHLKVHDSIDRRTLGVIKGLKTRKENQKRRDKLVKKEEKIIKKEEEVNTRLTIEVEVKKEDEYTCTCGQVFQRRSRMETCLRSHTLTGESNVHSCSTCDMKFKSKADLLSHRNKRHKRKFPCKFCPTDYDTQKALFKHLQTHQKLQLTEYKVISAIAKSSNELHCFLCNKTYSSLTELKSHVMEEHKEPYNCKHCAGLAFAKFSEIIEHMKTAHADRKTEPILDVLEAFSKLIKAWKCEDCGVQFYEADKLALHQIEDHLPEVKSEQHVQCPDCHRVFVSAQGLNSHSRMHHPKEVQTKIEPEDVGVLCLECRKICKDMNALASHMRLHSMDRKYPCKFCDFRFATPQKRKVHAEIHTGDMKYVCFICEYQCSSENRLKQHKMSIKHLNMKEYLLTGKPLIEEEPISKKKKVKEDHKRKKNKESETCKFTCDICGEGFPNKKEMDGHKSTHPFIEFPNEETPKRIFFK